MIKTTHNGIKTIIFDKEEAKFISFYLKNKKDSISQISHKYNRPPHLVRQWMEKGKMLFEL